MPEVVLIFDGNGRFHTGSKGDLHLCNERFEPGERVRAKITKKRSTRQNGFFHALIHQGFVNQQAGPEFEDEDQMKGWILLKAGWSTEERIGFPPDLPGSKKQRVQWMVPFVADLASRQRARHGSVAVAIDPNSEEIVFRYPRSTNFEKCDAEEFGKIVDKAVDLICTVIVPGTSPEELRTMAKGNSRVTGDVHGR